MSDAEPTDGAEYTSPTERKLRTGDAARRMCDIIALHQRVLTRDEIIAKRFIAISLADGSSDGNVYDTRDEAVNHQRVSVDPNLVQYLQIPIEGWNVYVCDTMLWYARKAYDAGVRVAHGGHLIIPQGVENFQ